MTLKIIGAGFGRTGTTSMKDALELLGYTKCHHMKEVMASGKQVDLFDQLSRGLQINWDEVFEGFEAAVDWPSAAFYKELMDHFPDAKVILTAREPERWYKSTRETIYSVSNKMPWILMLLIPRVRTCMGMINRLIWTQVFGGRFEDQQHALAVYNKNVEEVMATVPAHRLLVHSAKEGWEPLCAFLGKPVPNQPYPHSNEGKMLKRVVSVFAVIDLLPWVVLAGVIFTFLWQ